MLAGAVCAPALAWATVLGDAAAAALAATMAQQLPAPVLLNSYITSFGSDFDLTQANAAYVYDNALAGLALLASGHAGYAHNIASALAIAQDHDRFYTDGRLRNGYMAGVMAQPAKLPGWWDNKANQWLEDPYQAGSQTGPLAWAMLLWLAVGQKAAAQRAADWLNSRLRAPEGYYGGFYGFEPNPMKLTWQSTEQNTDLVAAFTKLGDKDSADHARKFVARMYNPQSGTFNAGLAPDGSVNTLLAADAGIWPSLAMQSTSPDYGPAALRAIEKLQHGGGIGFSAESTSIWLEGTAFALLALIQMKPDQVGDRVITFNQTLSANVSPSGYMYATVDPQLSTGLTVGPSMQAGVAPKPFIYFRRPSLSATAWTALAGLNVNPLG